jgi:putative component of membrane protein insertase Oxa1/YidC/SpoIIIJ protein YidD
LRSLLQHLALFFVASYQRHISPHKGFNCAHRTLTGELSCSEYFRQTLQQNGLSQALTELPPRLVTCKQSSRILYRQRYLAISPDPEASQPNTPDLEKKPNTPNLKKKPKRHQNTNQVCGELLDCGCLNYGNVSCLSGSDSSPDDSTIFDGGLDLSDSSTTDSSPADSTIFDGGLDLSDSSTTDSHLSDCDCSDCGDIDGCGF